MDFLVIIATFKNEATILKEWINHYLEQGVDHFYLIDDYSDDDYQSVLEPFGDKVSVFKPKEPQNRVNNYNSVFQLVSDKVNWVMVCDVTQYWYTLEGTLRNYLLGVNDTIDVITSPCRLFGNNNITHQPKNIRTTVTSVRGASFVKSIAKASVIGRVEVNQHLIKTGAVAKMDAVDIRVNDYDLLSLEYFLTVKMKRTHPDGHTVQRNWGDFLLQTSVTSDASLKSLTLQRQSQNKISNKPQYLTRAALS
jgi:hypothetical protein